MRSFDTEYPSTPSTATWIKLVAIQLCVCAVLAMLNWPWAMGGV